MRIANAFRVQLGGVRLASWLRPSPDAVREVAFSSREETRQRLRLKRFLLASGSSIVYLLVLVVFTVHGNVDLATLVQGSTIVVVLIVAFYVIFRLGINLRFADPSLTAPQVLAAVFTMLFVEYRAPETRVVFATFFFIALMFGMLRSSATQLTILGIVSLASYAAMTLGRYAENHDGEMLRIDMLQLCVTALAFPWFILIGSRAKQLKEADRRKDEFLATLAHELRNPLAPIRTGIHILRVTGADSQARPVLPMMECQLTHLTRLLDDLLDLSRITRGKIALQVERIDLRHAIHAAVETSHPVIQEMRHAFTASLPDEALWVDADPVRLAQVLSTS